MTKKKLTAFFFAVTAACSMFTSCSNKESRTSETATDTTTVATTAEESLSETSAAEIVEVEKAVEAMSGDAYLAIADGQWYVQYWGTDSDLLTYDAGVVSINKNGNYTVSVNGASKGMMMDVTGSSDEEYTPEGCSFMAVIVKDGMKLYPNMSIEITSIRINGEEIERTARNYTSSDDDEEMRANIYNEWVEVLPEDAHNSEGSVTDAGTYSAKIIDKDSIGPWTKIEVDFTVSGIGEDEEEKENV